MSLITSQEQIGMIIRGSLLAKVALEVGESKDMTLAKMRLRLAAERLNDMRVALEAIERSWTKP